LYLKYPVILFFLLFYSCISFAQERQVADSLKEMLHTYDSLGVLYSEKGNDGNSPESCRKALEYKKLYKELKDSLYKEEINNQITNLKEQYNTEKKQNEIEVLKKKNEIQELCLAESRYLLAGFSGMSLCIIIIVVLVYRQNRIRNRQNVKRLEQKLLRSQMNPDFILNTLTAVQKFMMKNDIVRSGEYISDFANLIRNVLYNSREEFVKLDKEAETLKYYLDLQQMRYGNSFDYDIRIDNEIDTRRMAIPPMLAQPFLDHFIRNGCAEESPIAFIEIIFGLSGKNIIFEITGYCNNEGKGDMAESDHIIGLIEKASMITKERLKVLNRYYKGKIKLSLEDCRDKKREKTGIKVTFFIPYKYII